MYIKEVIQKNKDGTSRKYLQFVESKRINGVPRQEILVNLGRVDHRSGKDKLEILTEALVKISEKLKILDCENDIGHKWSKEYGSVIVFRKLWEDSGLKKILEDAFDHFEVDFDLKETVFNMVLNRLTEPSSKNFMPCWEKRYYGVEEFEDHLYYRTMDYLNDKKVFIENRIFKNFVNQTVNIALFDTTSVIYYGKGEEGEDFFDFGLSKQKRSDLKQIVVAMIMTSKGVPVGYEVYPGNTNDVTCFKKIIKKLSTQYRIGRILLVGDRGMISKTNINFLREKKYNYILGFRMRTIEQNERAEIFEKANLTEIKKTLRWKEVLYKNQRLIVCYNPERALLDSAKRDDILERIRKKIKNKDIKSIIDNNDYKKFLNIQGKAPYIDQEKVDRDALYDGVYILTTNTKLRPGEVINRYKDLWQIEAGFRELKNELRIGPVYHRKKRRVTAHVFICFLALILKTILKKKLYELDKDISFKEIYLNLRSIYAIRTDIGKSYMIKITAIEDSTAKVFKALQMGIPKKTLYLHQTENSKKYVIPA